MKKEIIAVIVVGVIVSIAGVYAAATISANEIMYKDTTVGQALNILYEKTKNYNDNLKYDDELKCIQIYDLNQKRWICVKNMPDGLSINNYLYKNGDINNNLISKFEEVDRTLYSGITTSLESDYISIDGLSNGGGGGLYTFEKIDLTSYNKLRLIGNVSNVAYSQASGLILAVTTTKIWGSGYYPDNYVLISSTGDTTGDKELEIDISSLTGEYYIVAGINQSKGTITEIIIE